MMVREVMKAAPESCSSSVDLAAAAMIMWRNDCGIVPVVIPGSNKVQGVITDRDICMALATSGVRPNERTVGDVMARTPFTVLPEDSVQDALTVMKRERVRRLPVVDGSGVLQGMLSINDAILATAKGRGRIRSAVSADRVMSALRSICEHRRPAAEEALAAADLVHNP
jgi:CBS domain-containing protein